MRFRLGDTEFKDCEYWLAEIYKDTNNEHIELYFNKKKQITRFVYSNLYFNDEDEQEFNNETNEYQDFIIRMVYSK